MEHVDGDEDTVGVPVTLVMPPLGLFMFDVPVWARPISFVHHTQKTMVQICNATPNTLNALTFSPSTRILVLNNRSLGVVTAA